LLAAPPPSPYAPHIQVTSDADAVLKMNDTPYGLTAAVYSSNRQRA
jgi:acyl-CoA reductase-like NAD-dependent aldehyde dehydrogenase